MKNQKFKVKILILLIFLGITSISAEIQWSDDTYTDFLISSTRPQCFAEEDISYWIKWDPNANDGMGGIITEEVSDEAQNCFKEDGEPSLTCCPKNKGSCITTLGDPNFKKCLGPPHPFLCSGYTDKDSCEKFDLEVAKRSVERTVGKEGFCNSIQSELIGGQTCWWLIFNCRCYWNNADGNCQSAFSKSNSNCDGGPDEELGTCQFNEVSHTGDCNNPDEDFEEFFWTSDWIPFDPDNPSPRPEECPEELRKSFSCEESVKLPFFTLTNLIIAIILIGLIYYLIKRK